MLDYFEWVICWIKYYIQDFIPRYGWTLLRRIVLSTSNYYFYLSSSTGFKSELNVNDFDYLHLIISTQKWKTKQQLIVFVYFSGW